MHDSVTYFLFMSLVAGPSGDGGGGGRRVGTGSGFASPFPFLSLLLDFPIFLCAIYFTTLREALFLFTAQKGLKRLELVFRLAQKSKGPEFIKFC